MHLGCADGQFLAEPGDRWTAAVPDEQAEEDDDVLGTECGMSHNVIRELRTSYLTPVPQERPHRSRYPRIANSCC